jgi:hypothetical protein
MKVFTMRLARDGNIRRAFRSWNVAYRLCGSSAELQKPQVMAKKKPGCSPFFIIHRFLRFVNMKFCNCTRKVFFIFDYLQ